MLLAVTGVTDLGAVPLIGALVLGALVLVLVLGLAAIESGADTLLWLGLFGAAPGVLSLLDVLDVLDVFDTLAGALLWVCLAIKLAIASSLCAFFGEVVGALAIELFADPSLPPPSTALTSLLTTFVLVSFNKPTPCSLAGNIGGALILLYNGAFGSVLLPCVSVKTFLLDLSRNGPLLIAKYATTNAIISPISIPIPMFRAELLLALCETEEFVGWFMVVSNNKGEAML